MVHKGFDTYYTGMIEATPAADALAGAGKGKVQQSDYKVNMLFNASFIYSLNYHFRKGDC